MKTLDKYEEYSEEYEKEIKRENAYLVATFLGTIATGFIISKELQIEIFKCAEFAQREVGTEEITFGLTEEEANTSTF